MFKKPPIFEDFDLEMQSLRGGVLSMGRSALESVDRLGDLFHGDGDHLGEDLKHAGRELAHAEARIDHQARAIISRYHPIAASLVEVTGAVRMASDLEQIGGDARRLWGAVQPCRSKLSPELESLLENLWRVCRRALDDAFEAYQGHDSDMAEEVSHWKRDFRRQSGVARVRLARGLRQNGSPPGAFLDAMEAVDLLERIGLQTCSLAEEVFFTENAVDARKPRAGVQACGSGDA